MKVLASPRSPEGQSTSRSARGRSGSGSSEVRSTRQRRAGGRSTIGPGISGPAISGSLPPRSQAGGIASETASPLPASVVAALHRETLCSSLGLGLKVAVALVAGISLLRLAGAYQERMEHHAELRAVLDVQTAKLEKARNRFDQLFAIGGEQTLIRQQGQWIAPNRLRVVWNR